LRIIVDSLPDGPYYDDDVELKNASEKKREIFGRERMKSMRRK
jgi:hypothetical protein